MLSTMLSNLRRRMASALGFDTAPASAIGVTFGACCSNVVVLEQLVRLDPSCTSLVTFSQFAFIAAEKLVSETRFLTKTRAVPLRRYLLMVMVFFASSFLNNYALSFDIPMPLHMIFKSASLLSNMVLGIVILKRSYSMRKYSAVGLITFGIILCTAASRGASTWSDDATQNVPSFSLTQILGIGILVIALLLSSMMGILQEQVTADYGKHPGEMMFYIHALALPGFLLFTFQIKRSFELLMLTESVWYTAGMPTGLIALIVNVVTQYICISSVFKLSTECTSLTVTLVVTLRKFVSLVISIFYFGNEFTPQHWIGTALIFLGTFLFLDMSKDGGAPKIDVEKKES